MRRWQQQQQVSFSFFCNTSFTQVVYLYTSLSSLVIPISYRKKVDLFDVSASPPPLLFEHAEQASNVSSFETCCSLLCPWCQQQKCTDVMRIYLLDPCHTHTHTQHAFDIKLHMSPERNLILAIHTHTYNEHETHSNYASGDCKRHSISSTPIDDDILLPTYMNTLS